MAAAAWAELVPLVSATPLASASTKHLNLVPGTRYQ